MVTSTVSVWAGTVEVVTAGSGLLHDAASSASAAVVIRRRVAVRRRWWKSRGVHSAGRPWLSEVLISRVAITYSRVVRRALKNVL